MAINLLKTNTNSAKFLNETFPSDEQNTPFPFFSRSFLSFQLISPLIFSGRIAQQMNRKALSKSTEILNIFIQNQKLTEII